MKKMILENLNKKYPFIRFLFAAIITVVSLSMPECRVSAESNDSLPEWEKVIDRLMEETAWTSIDRKTNYMDIISSDMELYRDTYNLDASTETSNTMVLWNDVYGTKGERTSISCMQFFWNEDSMPITMESFQSGLGVEEIKKWRTEYCIGLYPDLCGVRLGDRYEDVCQILGIEEEMVDSLSDSFLEDRIVSWDEYRVFCDISPESERPLLDFVKGEKMVNLYFRRPADVPVEESYLYEIVLKPDADF